MKTKHSDPFAAELAARGHADPVKTAAIVREGLAQSAAGQTMSRGSFAPARRRHGSGIFAQINAAQAGEIIWSSATRTQIGAAAIHAGKQIEQATCWATEIRSGKTHKVIRVTILF